MAPLRRSLAERSWAADRYLVVSTERRLTDLDTNDREDVYIRDLLLGTIDGITVRSNGASRQASISEDGRFVVFTSSATDLVAGHVGQHSDVFLWNRLSNKVLCLTEGAQGDSSEPTISADGEVIAFTSRARLLPGDTDNFSDIYLYARQTGELTLLQGDHVGDAVSPTLNSDGTLAAFVAKQFGYWQIFGWDREENRVALLSRNDSDVAGNGDSFFPSLSQAGLVFGSRADNLVPGDSNSQEDVFSLVGSDLTRAVENASRPVLSRASLDGVFVKNGEVQQIGYDGTPAIRTLGSGQEASLSSQRVLLADGEDRKVLIPDKAITRTVNSAFQPSPPFEGMPFQNLGIARYGRAFNIDLDGDGLKDVVSLADDEVGPRGFIVAIARADGTFSSEYRTVGMVVNGYDQGDFNADGYTDLVFTGYTGAYSSPSGLLKVYFGDGAGDFTPGPTRPLARPLAVPLVGQFSGDGKLDVLIFNRSFGAETPPTAPQILVGSGNGVFTNGVSLPLTNSAGYPIVGDFDVDGFFDVAVLDLATGEVAIMLNDGNGGPRTTIQRIQVTSPGGLKYRDGLKADLDLDGDLDLLVDTQDQAGGQSRAQILTNTGGTFSLGPEIPIFYWGAYEENYVTSGDFDDDGFQEILLGSYLYRPNTGEVTVWKSGIQSVLGVLDFNDDGKLDLLLQQETGVAYVLGNGDATFGPPSVAGSPTPYLFRPRNGDFNGDMLLDIVDANGLLVGAETKSFTYQPHDLGSGHYEDLLVEDLNGDGHLDLLGYNSAGIYVSLGDGDGNFQALPHHPIDRLWGVAPEIQDIDQDGHVDLFLIRIGTTLDNSFEFWRGVGDGTFVLETSLLQRSSTSLIHVADINNDGAADVWASDYILFALSPGVFGAPVNRAAFGNYFDNAAFMDLDGDRQVEGFSYGPLSYPGIDFPDLEPGPVVHGPTQIFSYLGQSESVQSVIAGEPRTGQQNYWGPFVPEDVDGDGDWDITVLGSFGDLTTAINNGDGTYTNRPSLYLGTEYHMMQRLDYDFDGRFEKLVVGFGAAFIP